MSTNVECTQCGDAVSVESRTIILPFVCMNCVDVAEDFAETTQMYEDMDTAPSRFDALDNDYYDEGFDGTDQVTVDPAFVSPDNSVEVIDNGDGSVTLTSDPPLSDEFATVENTTLLIEDLEAQLADAQKEIDGLTMVYNAAQDTVEHLQLNLALIEIYFGDLAGRAVERLNALERRAKTAELNVESERRSSAIALNLQNLWKFWEGEAEWYREALRAERSKSLWQHFKEVTFDRL